MAGMGSLRGALVAALALAATSCGGAAHPATSSDADGLTVKTYAPLEDKADAKAPNRAVILGTDAKGGSTLLSLVGAQSKSSVDAMYVRMGGNAPASGGITPVQLATAPNTEGSVQVGIVEEFAGGTGPQWRAGVWISAFVAATTLNKDLTDFTFSASSGGYIDGASASGLMTGGFLASMMGTPIDPAATMTGTINPDGSIGPVAGIPEKFLGSIEKGKKRLGYPIGMRYAKSEASKQMVDLVQLAKDHGAEAIEISNVREAYKLLTGKVLPEPLPVTAADMALDASTTMALEERYAEWQKRVATEWATIVQLQSAGRLPHLLGTLREYAQSYTEAAEQLHRDGHTGAAYSKLLAAWAFASATTTTYDLLSKVQAGNIEGAGAALAALAKLDENTQAVFEKIGKIRPTTLGGHLMMLASFESALRGWVFQQFASQAVAQTGQFLASLSGTNAAELGSPAAADKVTEAVAPTVLYVLRTLVETSLAVDELTIEREESVSYLCSLPNVHRMSTSFASAGAAGMNYFDTLLVQPIAESMKISEDAARTQLARVDPTYLISFMATKVPNADGLPEELKHAWGDHSLSWGLMSLASSELAYFGAAELIAKYYSLGVHTSGGGKVDGVDHQKAFDHMLVAAERAARESARAARIAAGAIPIQAKLAYESAIANKDGDLSAKVDALTQFWWSSAYSQTAVMLARN